MLKELVDNSLVKILKVKFGRDFATGRSDCADVLTHYEQLRQYWMVIFWTLEASVGRTSSKRFPPTSASAAPSTSTQRWRRRCMQGEGIRRRQYLAFKGWSRSWSRRRARRRGWRCWRWRRARLALTWDSRSFCTFIFFILSKMLNVCMDERLSADNLALALSWLFIGATVDKTGNLRCQVLCWGNHTKHIREMLLRFPPSVAEWATQPPFQDTELSNPGGDWQL